MNIRKPSAHTPSKYNPALWHDLDAHLRKVAKLCRKYAQKIGAPELGEYAGLWHDLGKYNPKFQQYLQQCAAKSQYAKSVPHALYGAKLASKLLPLLVPIIYGHHAGLKDRGELRSKMANSEYEADYAVILGAAAQDGIELEANVDLGALMASFGDPQKYEYSLSCELFTRLLFSCLLDADYLDTESHFDPQQSQRRSPIATVDELWPVLEASQSKMLAKVASSKKIVNQVRTEVYHACIDRAEQGTGVFRLAVPTGGGKTLSGLSFALKHAAKNNLDRVIIAVPYTSIIEQTVGVYREIFGEEAVLEHHSAAKSSVDDEDARAVQAQARLATQNWNAPLIVTTTVQLLESLFHNKTGRCRKLHNIVNSVIVLDEVQALPIGLLEPTISVLQELVDRYRVTVVLCTATQPALAGDGPYLTGFRSICDIIAPDQAKEHFRQLSRVNYQIHTTPWSTADVVADAGESKQGLVVLNTRKDALRVLQEFQGAFSKETVFHLSTLLCGAHRRKVLQEVRSRLKAKLPCWLISTQVVEAGVDLDFPLVYRVAGPLDRIVQAAGRCNREGEGAEKGRVVVFWLQDGKVPQGAYATAVTKTMNRLQQDPDFDDPEIFQSYFRELYQLSNTDEAEVQKYRREMNYPKVAQQFKLIKDETHPVVIPYQGSEELLKRIERYGLKFSDYQALQPFLVSLRDREFQQATDSRREISPGIWRWEGEYDNVTGICLDSGPVVYDPVDLVL